MDDRTSSGTIPIAGHVPDAHGRYFTCHFDGDGYLTDDPAAVAWTWSSHDIGNLHARRQIAADETLPQLARETFLSPHHGAQIEMEGGWLFGDLPDLRHDYSREARGLGHFRFCFDARVLICGRKQPLRSVDAVRRLTERRARAFKAPAEIIEAVMTHSLDALGTDLLGLGEQLDGIEDRIVCDAWHSERQPLVEVRRRLVVIHRQLSSLSGLLRHVDREHGDELAGASADMVARLAHRASTFNHDSEQIQARARLLQDELMARLTAETNRLLYLISVMTAVLLPMSIIAGLFGMNVGGIPFFDSGGGFWIVTLLSLVVAAATLHLVRRFGSGG